jgi:hypothetical protein
MASTELTLKFEFFDMKYLSNTIDFTSKISDPSIIGNTSKTGKIDIYFKQLEESDANNGTKYVVGGRTYFEATVFGAGYQSFTTKGFFDKKDYVEPTASTLKGNKLILGFTISGCIVGAFLLGLLIYCCYCKKTSHTDDHSKVE